MAWSGREEPNPEQRRVLPLSERQTPSLDETLKSAGESKRVVPERRSTQDSPGWPKSQRGARRTRAPRPVSAPVPGKPWVTELPARLHRRARDRLSEPARLLLPLPARDAYASVEAVRQYSSPADSVSDQADSAPALPSRSMAAVTCSSDNAQTWAKSARSKLPPAGARYEVSATAVSCTQLRAGAGGV